MWRLIERLALATIARRATQSTFAMAAILGAFSAAFPAAIQGHDVTLGLAGGAQVGFWWAAAMGPLTAVWSAVLVGLGDLDSGVDREQHLSGLRRATRWVARAVTSGFITVTCFGLCVGGAGIAGTADQLRRRALGPAALEHDYAVPGQVVLLITATVGAWLAMWLILAVVSSARQAMSVLAAAVTTLIGGLALATQPAIRDLLVFHPLGGLWSLAYRGQSFRLRIDVGQTVAILSASAWAVALIVVALVRQVPRLRRRRCRAPTPTREG